MVDSASGSKIYSENSLYDFSAESNKLVVEKFLQSLHTEGNLSEAELKFLSYSKERRSSAKLLENIVSSAMTLSNYEEVLYLKNYKSFLGTINPEQKVRNIRYKDDEGNIVATLQIDTLSKKLRMQNLGNFLPHLECFSPNEVGTKIQNMARYNNWTSEDGGVNRFNGNREVRYKDKNGNVMAAIITKENGVFDTIAEYEYKTGYLTKMTLTNTYGNSIVMYDGTKKVNQDVRIDIDNDGMIIEITKVYTD